VEIRRLTLDDHASSYRLGAEAFGASPQRAVPDAPAALPPGRDTWGAFDGGELVAGVSAHSYESWWHGARVATCGIASVVVAAERRGQGLLLPLFEATLGAAAERGEPLSTLFPTANGIYRSLGYELVSSYDTVVVPTAELAGVRAPVGTRTRRARAGDVPALKAVYDAWAAAQNGPLTRTGPLFAATDQELLDDVTAVTLAVTEDDEVVGYATWDRGEGYDPATAGLVVHDLVATTADAYRALWRVLGTHTSVAGRVTLHTSGEDPARLVLPTATWDVVGRHPYMLRVGDPAAAFAGLPGLTVPGLRAEVRLAVAGDRLATADGTYRLALGDGPATCERVAPDPAAGVATFTTQGLALAYAGAQSCANLRMTGHLSGDDSADAVLDAVLGARPLHIRDYF
jgi:predicted acetyltransferase